MGAVEDLETIKEGALGHFWENSHQKEAEPVRGYVQQKDAWWEVQVLEDVDPQTWFADEETPEMILAMTTATSAMFLEIANSASSRSFGGFKASTRTFSARTAITDVPLDRILSNKVMQLRAHFLNLSRWSGRETISYEGTRDEDGRATKLGLTLEALGEQTHRLKNQRVLTISSTWQISDRNSGSPRIYAPITFSCGSTKPREVWTLLSPLLRIQDLISLSYDRFIQASGGDAVPQLAPPSVDERHFESLSYPFWNGALMHRPVFAPDDRAQIPSFGLVSLGGAAGVARWTQLADTFRREVNAVVRQYREGHLNPIVKMLNSASAIEHYVNRHSRTAQWATLPKSDRKKSPIKALARHVGGPFARFVGDPDKWSELCWDTYNEIKHDPNAVISESQIYLFAESARLLLAAALLNRAGMSRIPSRHILGGGPAANLSYRLREQFSLGEAN